MHGETRIEYSVSHIFHCTHLVDPIMFEWGVKRLSRFSGVSQAFLGLLFIGFLAQFPRF
jgi:hypothetical protein